MTSTKSATTAKLKYPAGWLKKPDHRKARRKQQRDNKQRMIEWHNKVCNRAMIVNIGADGFIESIPDPPLFRCYHCGHLFPRNEVCGDHFPHSRGARPDLKYDPENGVCSCMNCNRSDHPNRLRSLKHARGL